MTSVCAYRLLPTALLALALAGCATAGSGQPLPPVVKGIQNAHGFTAWRDHRALEAEMLIVPLDGPPLRGIMTFTTDGTRSRLDMDDNAGITFDGLHAWVWPATSTMAMPRFQVRKWPYVIAVPFKLQDAGTRLSDLGNLPCFGRQLPAAKLTFAPGVGDAPDDWYVLYGDPDTGRLAAMAYVSTYGTRSAGPPQCIVFDRFKTVEGVTLATGWTFYAWSQDKGPHGPPTGNAILDSLKFVDPPEHFFDKPVMAREDPVPAP